MNPELKKNLILLGLIIGLILLLNYTYTDVEYNVKYYTSQTMPLYDYSENLSKLASLIEQNPDYILPNNT